MVGIGNTPSFMVFSLIFESLHELCILTLRNNMKIVGTLIFLVWAYESRFLIYV